MKLKEAEVVVVVVEASTGSAWANHHIFKKIINTRGRLTETGIWGRRATRPRIENGVLQRVNRRILSREAKSGPGERRDFGRLFQRSG